MKNSILIICLFSISLVSAQEESKAQDKHYGFAINSSLSGTLNSLSVAPTGFLYVNKHQLELGLAIHPGRISSNNRNLGVEFNYKYFPNGIANRFNMYFTTNLTLTNQHYEQNYSGYRYERRTNFLNLTGGYGFQVSLFKKAYVGTSLNVGVMTCRDNIKNSYGYSNYVSPMFNEFYLDAAVRLNIGYRF
ncbi:MAG: hypothetical protein P8P74_14280 [Crocinitomicaceae bacterium]|nr:hypothetical protein [Crocinitomicaceae bacterium]